MPLSRSRDYLSIGEVLEAVKADFPDVSISKIRFLEAEGLIEPERTPSGYRKFFEKDVATLRFILGLQRDHFLPLKVIKERLASGSNGGGPPLAPATSAAPAEASSAPAPVTSEVVLSAGELRSAAGLDDAALKGLIEYGIIDGTKDTYDGDDLVAAKAAAGLLSFGVEPRHLKMYRHFAEREAAFFEQIVLPLKRRGGPEAQREASRSLGEMTALAQRFRDAMLRSTMRDLL